MTSLMKGWQYTALGSDLSEALTLSSSIPAPLASSLAKDQILIRVISASLNPADYKIYEATLMSRLSITLPGIPGMDFCGEIVAVHSSNTTTFKEGQRVFGSTGAPGRYGSLGEMMIVSIQHCALLPDGVEPDQAAALSTTGLRALQSLDPDFVKPGSKVFINGGSGGIGSFAIQIAKILGAHVTTSCSFRNLKLCESLGADEVLDYENNDIIETLISKGTVFDLVIDAVGNPQNLYERSGQFLKTTGAFHQVNVAPSLYGIGGIIMRAARPRFLGGGDRKFVFMTLQPHSEGLERIAKWVAEGRMTAVIEKVYEFEDAAKAYASLRLGRTRGKIVVRVASA